jgi:hypothetical protein
MFRFFEQIDSIVKEVEWDVTALDYNCYPKLAFSYKSTANCCSTYFVNFSTLHV